MLRFRNWIIIIRENNWRSVRELLAKDPALTLVHPLEQNRVDKKDHLPCQTSIPTKIFVFIGTGLQRQTTQNKILWNDHEL